MADDLSKKFEDINADAGDLRANLASVTREMTQLISQSAQLAANFGVSRDYNTKTRDLAKELSQISEKDLTNRKEVNKLQSQAKELSRKLRSDQVELNRLNLLKQNAVGAEVAFLNKLIAKKYEEISISQEVLNTTNDILSVAKELNNQTKYWDKASEFLNRIPVVGPTLSKPFKDISAALQEANVKGTDPLVAGFKAAAGSIATLSLGFFIQQAFKASSQVTDLQKVLLLSKNEAYALRQEFIGVAAASGDAFITTDKLLEANAELSKQLGFAKNFGADLNIEFVNLTKRLGLSAEAAGGLAIASIATGRSLKSIDEDAASTVSSISAQYGIQLNVRDVLEEAGAASALMLANFQGNPIALVKGISQVKALGTSLNQVNKQANALLDFQTSIESQLNASLLTGQQINLERARELALNNNLSGLAEELVSQQIDYNGFLKLNRSQRDAIARAVGLESEELADQLLKIEYQNRSRTNTLALMGEEALKRAEALSAQDKFNAAINKLSGLLGNLLDGPLGKMVDLMATIASSSATIYTFFGSLAAIQLGSAVLQIMKVVKAMRTLAIGSAIAKAVADPLSIAVGLAAAVGAGALIGSMFDSTLGGDEEISSISSAVGAARSSSNNNINQSTSTNELDYNKLAQSMSNVKLSANVRVNDLANPVTMYQQQNMRRSV
jgi:hypothetical protein